MKKTVSIILLFLIFLYPIQAFSAEKIVWNGQEGVFFNTENAQKLVLVQEENLVLRNKISLLEEKLRIDEEKINLLKTKDEINLQIIDTYKAQMDIIQKGLEDERTKDSWDTWKILGAFTGGLILGVLAMYVGSVVVRNVR